MRRQAERAANARTIETWESMSDAFFTVDDAVRLTNVNGPAEQLLGHSRAELLTRKLLDFLPGAEGQPIWTGMLQALHDQIAGLAEGNFGLAGAWVSARFHPVEGGLAVYLQDVSEQKRLGAQLHQSQKLEAVGLLASGVAHDFNNVLTIIEGYSALGQARLESDPQFIVTALQEIRAASASAGALTARLLAFSRNDPAAIAVTDINEIVKRALNLVAPLIGEDITVHRILTPERIGVEVDASQIESVIVNLAVTARDAMGTGGDLWVASGLTHVDVAGAWELAPGGYAFVSVRDNGSGMDATTRDRIFDPFFTTKAAGQGTGLGRPTRPP